MAIPVVDKGRVALGCIALGLSRKWENVSILVFYVVAVAMRMAMKWRMHQRKRLLAQPKVIHAASSTDQHAVLGCIVPMWSEAWEYAIAIAFYVVAMRMITRWRKQDKTLKTKKRLAILSSLMKTLRILLTITVLECKQRDE